MRGGRGPPLGGAPLRHGRRSTRLATRESRATASPSASKYRNIGRPTMPSVMLLTAVPLTPYLRGDPILRLKAHTYIAATQQRPHVSSPLHRPIPCCCLTHTLWHIAFVHLSTHKHTQPRRDAVQKLLSRRTQTRPPIQPHHSRGAPNKSFCAARCTPPLDGTRRQLRRGEGTLE